MYIARRTGGGRGVYEIAGATTTGLTSGDLLNRQIVFEFAPELLLPSGLTLHAQGGKHRLKMAGGEIQVQRQIAAALMLPSPRRANEGLGSSPQVAKTKEYVIERIQLGFVNAIASDKAFVVPDNVELKNAVAEQSISVQGRLGVINGIWAESAQLPEPLRSLVNKHKELVTAGNPIALECEQVVSEIQKAAATVWTAETTAVADPLNVLAAHLGLSTEQQSLSSEPPVSVPEFAVEGGFNIPAAAGVPERIRRAIIQRRGQRSFRKALLTAYGAKCQVTQYTGEPALEAAHIYPYAEGGEYTNDPRNGLLLRADVHVLFDIGLLKVTPESLVIKIMPPLDGSSYKVLDGTPLWVGAVLKPSNDALAKKFTQAY